MAKKIMVIAMALAKGLDNLISVFSPESCALCQAFPFFLIETNQV